MYSLTLHIHAVGHINVGNIGWNSNLDAPNWHFSAYEKFQSLVTDSHQDDPHKNA